MSYAPVFPGSQDDRREDENSGGGARKLTQLNNMGVGGVCATPRCHALRCHGRKAHSADAFATQLFVRRMCRPLFEEV